MSFLILLTCHILGDFVLQSNFLALNKGKYPLIMFVHCYVWSICIILGLMLLGIVPNIYLFLYLVIVHWIIDIYKCRKKSVDALGSSLYLDQFLHLVQIYIAYMFL